MNMHTTVHHSSKKLVIHTVLSMLVFLIGVAGVIYMITVEDDPALVPLLLIALGIGWFVVARLRLRP